LQGNGNSSPKVQDVDADSSAGSIRTRPKGELSQSELDWAYAKRKLAMGVDPEKVIQAIAEYRPDKWNPEAYAKRTVEKALAEIQAGSSEEVRSPVDR
jgi:hypothetical protein